VTETLARLQDALKDRYRLDRELGQGGTASRLAARLSSVAVLLLAVAVAASCDFDRQRWRKVQAADSVSAYEAFLARNPRSPYVDSARARIAELRLRQAAAAFREAAAQNTVSSYWNFAHRYRTFSIYGQFPNRHVKEAYAAYLDSAEARLDELEFREAEAANTFDSYWHFVFRRTKLRSAYLDSAIARMLRAPTAPGYNVRGLVVHRCNGRPVIVEGYQRYAHVFERPSSPGDTYGGRSFKSIGGGLGLFLFSLPPGEYVVFQSDQPGGFFVGSEGDARVRVARGRLADFRLQDSRCPDIHLVAPLNRDTTSERPQFEWEPYRDDARYQVLVDGDRPGASPRVSPQTFETHVQLEESLSPGDHEWKVCVVGDRTRVRWSLGGESDCSFANHFTVARPPVPAPSH
jgi:hypothetical protein